jgi:glycosyltransferase involved in cell wall biosynthesis
MPRFSLIVGTIDRTEEFSLLLRSLAQQKMRDFELIVVDQNPDDRLSSLLEEWVSGNGWQDNRTNNLIEVKHLHCPPGVSRARNLGLLHSSGEIVAFPDDDCWYLPDTLQNVDEWFNQHPNYGILTLGSRDEQGRVSGNRWVQKECDLTRVNVFRASATYTYFVRRPPEVVTLRFDESLGPGAVTRFDCGDDTDVLLTLMSHGIRGRFYSALYVGHPYKPGFVDVQRAARYGGGFGRVLAKHSLPFLFFALVTFDFTRAASRVVLGDLSGASRFWAHGRGIIRGYFSK